MIRTLITAAGLAASAAGALAQQPDPVPPPVPVQKKVEPLKDNEQPKVAPPKTDTPVAPPKTDTPVAPPKIDTPVAPPKTDTPVPMPLTQPAPVPGGSVLLPPTPAAPPVRVFADYPPSNLPPPGQFGYGTLPPRIPYGPSVSPLEYPYPLYSTPPGAAWPQSTPIGAPHGVYGRKGRY